MRYIIRDDHIKVIGKIWSGAWTTYQHQITNEDIKEIGNFTKENVKNWLNKKATDFELIKDFYATFLDDEIHWESEKSEGIYSRSMEDHSD